MTWHGCDIIVRENTSAILSSTLQTKARESSPSTPLNLNVTLLDIKYYTNAFIRVLRFSSLHKSQHSEFQFNQDVREELPFH